MKNKRIFKYLSSYILITASGALYAVAFCWFYQPNSISAGGFTGISQILNYIFPVLPIGITTVAINIPLFIIGIRLQGIKILIRSLYSMTVSSLMIDFISSIHTFSHMDDLLLASVFGGLLAGISSGLQLKVNATTGGTELAARLLKYKVHHISVGKICLMVDIVIVLLYAITFRRINNALYGIASMYIFSLAVDFVIYGGTHAKMAYIISSKSEDIKIKLLEMNFGVTTIDSHGGWKQDDKQMIMCVVKRTQIAAIKAVSATIDPAAFVVVCEAYEVLGEGFGTYSPGDL